MHGYPTRGRRDMTTFEKEERTADKKVEEKRKIGKGREKER